MAASSALDRVLGCPNLPTLPRVAMQVLELTRDPNVTISQLAKVVQSDPSMSAKILRTVNSSFFGLSQPCSKIDRALSLLGLNTIKSLVLGFTLVESTRGVDGNAGLDLTAHWRRAVYSASAARNIAVVSKQCDPDEAFTGAMLQDIGMMAAIVAMPRDYGMVLSSHKGDHEDLPATERAAISFDHAEIGAAIGRKWHLPEAYIQSIAFHHNPAAAPAVVRPLVEVIWLGMLVAESLSGSNSGGAGARAIVAASQVLRTKPEDLGPMLQKIAKGADELAAAFEQEVGDPPNIAVIMAEAAELLMNTQLSAQTRADELARVNTDLTRQATTDGLTGVGNRKALDADMSTTFAKAQASGQAIGFLFLDADKFKSVNDSYGHPAGDAVLVELARRAVKVMEENGYGRECVYRYGGEEFAIVLNGVGRSRAGEMAEHVRGAIESVPFDLSMVPGDLLAIRVTTSIGYSAWEPGEPSMTHERLIKLADEGVYAAKQGGRNQTRCVQHATPIAVPAGQTVLLVEDDALAARLIQAALLKAGATQVAWCKRVDEACICLGSSDRISVVVCDYNLGGRTALDVIAASRALMHRAMLPIVITSCGEGTYERERCLSIGATSYWSKAEICNDLSGWCKAVLTEPLHRKVA